jgi:DNA invertase Pin-like site-specific DNA recombinase
MPLAYSYLRFSHPDQSNGDSLRRQTELRDAWLVRNHVTLDTSLTLEDKGVSGYTGEHRDNPDRHALAAFVALVKKGRIARGSYLVVENLDRLSREDIIPAMALLLDLIQSGVRVVQLLPVETVYDAQSNPMHLMMAIMELSRGHSESAMKSERVGRAWQDKKRRAAENGEPVTARAPAWLRLVDGKWQVLKASAQAVRRIYRLAKDGYGSGVITKKLNAAHVPVVGRGGHWARAYVAKLLSNRAVIGEYQPYKGRGKTRRPDGQPISHYYPAIISEGEWYAARAAVAHRRAKPGRLAKRNINVFAGLLFDARDGGSVQMTNKGKKSGYRPLLVSYKAVQGVEGSHVTSFPFDTFEKAILSCLHEIDPREVLPQEDGAEDEALVLAGRLAEIEADIEKLKTRLQRKYSDAVADVLERQEAIRQELAEQLAQARREAASPLGESWGQFRSLVDVLASAPDPQDVRVRLRAALRRMLAGIWCLFVARGAQRLAAVQVWFQGDGHRDYLILHQPATGGFQKKRPSSWRAWSLAEVTKAGDVDLRQAKYVREVERQLRSVQLKT